MSKVLLMLAVVAVAWWWWRRSRSGDEAPRQRGEAAPGQSPRREAPRGPAEPTPMLACAHCGVHLPQADAILDSQGLAYCGEAHRLAGPR